VVAAEGKEEGRAVGRPNGVRVVARGMREWVVVEGTKVGKVNGVLEVVKLVDRVEREGLVMVREGLLVVREGLMVVKEVG
jgi:hypothetical protein